VIDVLSLPFDQYQRYRLTADLLTELRALDGPLKVLDVGGRTAILRSFLPADDIVLVDVEESDEPGLVLGDGGRLPFRTDSFDAVAAFDTLEHVPPQFREAFVAECARVSKGYVILAGPYKSPEVDEAEELLQSFMREKLGLEHRYLNEHRENGLPDRSQTERQFGALGAKTKCFGHGNLDRWLLLMCLELYLDHDPGLRPLAKRFFKFYNQSLYRSDHARPVYRHLVVAAFNDRPLPTGGGMLDVPQAPADTIKSVTPLALELLAFDREADVWKVEFDRLNGIIKDLEEDLDGHKSRLADTASDLEEHKKSLEELESVHAGALADHAEIKAALEADLAAHDKTIEETRATLAATRADFEGIVADKDGQIAALEAHQAELEEQLAAANATAQKIQDELLGATERIRERDELIAAMRADMRKRINNLKRIFKKPEF